MNQQNAEKIVIAIDQVFDTVSVLLETVNSSCEGEILQNFQHAIGVVLAELDLEILEVIYKNTPIYVLQFSYYAHPIIQVGHAKACPLIQTLGLY